MDYLTAKETAEKWGISIRQVQQYCANNKISGAVRRGHQWMVPFDALRPADGRFLASRRSPRMESYHFPAFIYSKYYSFRDELSEDELLLLDAQIHNLKNEFMESIHICNSLLSTEASPSVKFGAYFTNATNYLVLGLASEIPSCVKAMENICQNDPMHQEDYKLLIAFFSYCTLTDNSSLFKIDITKLSPQALIMYEFATIHTVFFSDTQSSYPALSIYQAICREVDILGIAPVSIILHSILATLYSRRGDKVKEETHIEETCRIGYESGLERLLTKSYQIIDHKMYRHYLSKYFGSTYYNKIETRSNENAEKARLSYNILHETTLEFSFSSLEYEIVALLMYKTSISDIATLKGITEKEVRDIIKDLCKRYSLESKKELVEYYKKLFLPKDL